MERVVVKLLNGECVLRTFREAPILVSKSDLIEQFEKLMNTKNTTRILETYASLVEEPCPISTSSVVRNDVSTDAGIECINLTQCALLVFLSVKDKGMSECNEACHFVLSTCKTISPDTFAECIVDAMAVVKGNTRYSQCSNCAEYAPEYAVWGCDGIHPGTGDTCGKLLHCGPHGCSSLPLPLIPNLTAEQKSNTLTIPLVQYCLKVLFPDMLVWCSDCSPLTCTSSHDTISFLGDLSVLMYQQDSWIFNSPVDTVEYSTYLRLIKQPMDLGTVLVTVRRGEVTAPKFEELVRQVFINAIRFNANTSWAYNCARYLYELFESFTRVTPFPGFPKKRGRPKKSPVPEVEIHSESGRSSTEEPPSKRKSIRKRSIVPSTILSGDDLPSNLLLEMSLLHSLVEQVYTRLDTLEQRISQRVCDKKHGCRTRSGSGSDRGL